MRTSNRLVRKLPKSDQPFKTTAAHQHTSSSTAHCTENYECHSCVHESFFKKYDYTLIVLPYWSRMILRVPAVAASPIVVASAHGLSDFRGPPVCLIAYLLLLFPLPHVTTCFLVASILHFSFDVGLIGSALLHATWGLLAKLKKPRVAWASFAAYYTIVHARPRLQEWFRSRPRQTWCALVCCGLASVFLPPGDLIVGEMLQKLVISHVVVDDLRQRCAQ